MGKVHTHPIQQGARTDAVTQKVNGAFVSPPARTNTDPCRDRQRGIKRAHKLSHNPESVCCLEANDQIGLSHFRL